ncbi:hypothetical protein [Pontimicrobium sp. MEBiC01747]
MKKLLFLTCLLSSLYSFSQKEGQDFCEGDRQESYFPLLKGTKYIIWYNTYYAEKNIGTKNIEGETYIEYEQLWEKGSKSTLFLKETNNAVYQFEDCCNDDTIRLPKEIEVGKKWTTTDNLVEYEIVSLDGTLKTPVCHYKNLLVIKYTSGKEYFKFYYLKGYGYIGGTKDEALISFAMPIKPERK